MKQSIPILVVFLLLATSAVHAEIDPSGTYTGTPAGTSSGEFLWSQLDEPSGSTWIDQAFEAPYAGYDSWGADDFVLPVTSGGYSAHGWWAFGTLYTPGTVSVEGASPLFVNVAFYEDAGGRPGSVVCDLPANTNFTLDGGDLKIDLSGCNIFSPWSDRHLWFSQQVRMDFDPGGQHRWATRLSANGDPGLWKNPGNDFGTFCIDWQPMHAICGADGEDWLFEVSATETFPQPPEGVPTVGPFGAVLLVLALGGGSVYVLRRRG